MSEPSAGWAHWYQNEPYHHGRPPLHFNPRFAQSQISWRPQPPFMRLPHPRFQRSSYYAPRPPPPSFCRPPPPPWARCPPPTLNIAPSYAANSFHQDLNTHHPQQCISRKRQFPCSSKVEKGKTKKVTTNISSKANDGLSQVGEDSDTNRTTTTNAATKPQEQADQHKVVNGPDSSLSLILMRGLPGSGKSTLAQDLLSTGPNGLIFSTDDYFVLNGGYNPSLLTVAHKWNQDRAKEAMQKGHSPVIIDNTNVKAWEMKPYVKMALERGYQISFHEPDTPWKFDPTELAKRNTHGVVHQKIAMMLDHYSVPISIDLVMSSQSPINVKNNRRTKNKPRRVTKKKVKCNPSKRRKKGVASCAQ